MNQRTFLLDAMLCVALALVLIACGIPEKSERPIGQVRPIEIVLTLQSDQSAVAQSACDHPYLPVRSGAQWIYSVTAVPSLPDYTEPITVQWTVHNVTGNTRHATMSLSPYQEDQFECDPATGIAALGYDYTSTGFAKMFHLFLPPADRLQPGYSWSGSNHQGMKLGGGMIALREDLTETYTVIGNEPVAFDGKTYEGLSILRTATAHVAGCGFIPNCTNSDGTLRQDTDWRTTSAITLTLARGVGIVGIVETEKYFGAGDQHQVRRRTYTLTDYYLPDKRVPTPVQMSATLLPTFTPFVIGPTATSSAKRTPRSIAPTISTATYQCDDATPSGGRVWQTCYLTTPDGQIIALLSTGAWFWREEQLHQAAPK